MFGTRRILNSPPLLRFLLAPVISQSTTSRPVYLPDGANWYEYNLDGDASSLTKLEKGGTNITVDADISCLPVYVRQGAILPTRYVLDGSVKPINAYTEQDPLVFEVFSGHLKVKWGDATSTMAELLTKLRTRRFSEFWISTA